MTPQFNSVYKQLVEKMELNIARGVNRKHLFQVPNVARAKIFAKGYTPRTKTSKTIIDVAKGSTAGVWALTPAQVEDISHKYRFDIPTENGGIKQLGTTGIIILRKAPGKYFLIKKV